METALSDVEGVDFEEVADSNAILLGSPNHIGRPARSISKFIDRLGKKDLKAKKIAVFDTYMGEDLEGCEENGEENK